MGGWRDGSEEAVAEGVDGEEQSEDGERDGDACGPVVRAEEAHGAGGEPIHERRLVEETEAVDGGGDEVVALEHLAGDLDVNGVDVVQQAGGEEATKLQHGPRENDEGEGANAPAVGRIGSREGHGRGLSVSRSLPEVSARTMAWGRRCSASARRSKGTKRILRAPVPHCARSSS